MKKLKINCDMDCILASLIGPMLDAVAADHGVHVSVDEIVLWDMGKCGRLSEIPPKDLYGYFEKPGFFRNLPPLPGAIDGLRALVNMGHDVKVVSTHSGAVSAKEKLEWMAEHAPFISRKKVWCIGGEKHLLPADILIDDHPDTLVEFVKEHPGSQAIGIEWPYNRQVPQMPGWLETVPSYKDTAGAWKRIVEIIEERSK